MKYSIRFFAVIFAIFLTACSTMYYSGLEKIGIPKRDVLVYRVEKARDTQEETREQFKSALEQFSAATNFKGGDLEGIYKKLNGEYEASVNKAKEVRSRIEDIENVSAALFREWEQEITQYSNPALKRSSQDRLTETRSYYKQLIAAMKNAESRIQPVLTVFNDQVMYLKHNLNARAIASLKGELKTLQSNVSTLVAAMEKSINEANTFISNMEKN
ncbi:MULTISPECIES: DUF2959 domain-containing protein [Nitrosomonas]|uniref:DUF2959 domain-containing protein n=1 Tax=Nitrosomonas europaea (strain ATCC 19718 / CIP 103999 / KCTC 2705 / NBRC 14298) TaxID=228410 RepID=Q82W88_NITEU|nr:MULTISPECIES: DUF2959 domain-containing protein [Nitrosomonas]MCE7917103.1 DUF2959 domain-containing protein [Nitrosomonas sp. PRO5]KXK46008.1 MAG: hypothetical protein UZ02_AOB001000833 [Nitrosomonas europaea]MBV6389977.1 hypothetical protein [Nitrosomonas europaea]QOJ08775.1 MAG: DUF2959 domain-containing protein [Nitrosomonas sp. H1_AOB3]CAD84717.1 hypothetical protein NE0806 [Nitrosomonas europaea ATCC 19718]